MSSSQSQSNDLLVASPQKQIKNRNQTINMLQTQYSLTASNQEHHGETLKNKMNSFKKIKAEYLQQKNNSGKAIKKIKSVDPNVDIPSRALSSFSDQCVNTLISNFVERLDDAATIYSQQSHHQRQSEFSQHVQFDDNDSFLFLSPGSAASPFKKWNHERQMSLNPSQKQINLSPTKKYYTLPNQEVSEYPDDNKNENYNWFFNETTTIQMRVIKTDPNLVVSQESGALFNFEHYSFKSGEVLKFANLISNKNIYGLLKFYGIFSTKNVKLTYPINSFCYPNSLNKQYIALFEPYTQTLTECLLKYTVVSYSQFCRLLLDIISIILQLCQNKIFIQVDPFNVININGTIKIKMKFDEIFNNKKVQEKDVIRSLGVYLNTHFKFLYRRQGKNVISKIEGIDMFKRVQVKQFIDDIVKQKILSVQAIHRRAKKVLSF